MRIKYGIHTFVCKHRISRSESDRIKWQLGCGAKESVIENKSFCDYGITEFSIKERNVRYQEENGYKDLCKYELVLRVNCSRTLGKDGNMIMELSNPNVKKLKGEIERVLTKRFKLDVHNADFGEWFIERLDDAFDIELDNDPREMVYRLNSTLFMPSQMNLKHYKGDDTALDFERAHESVYFGNNSYTMNVYAKWYEMKKRNPELSENDPMFRVLRVERQGNQQYVKNCLPDRKVKDLLEKENNLKLLFSLKNLVKTFWRTENYPGGLCNLIDSAYPDKPKSKKYSQFAVPKYDKINNRYKVSMTVHYDDRRKGNAMYASGKTFDDCQAKMFWKLKGCYATNRLLRTSTDGIIQDIYKFRHTIKSEQLLAAVDAFLKENMKEDREYAEDERAKYT